MIEIHEIFAVHKLNAEGMARAQDIAKLFSVLLNNLGTHCPDGGRDLAIVCTKLEEACFFAKRSMATLPENQEP